MSQATFATSLAVDTQLRLARNYLHSSYIAEALALLGTVLSEQPDWAEAHLLLADCYLASGDAASAAVLYQRAWQADPSNGTALLRLNLTAVETSTLCAPADPLSEPALTRLTRSLTGRQAAASPSEVARATQVLETIARSAEPAREVANRLDEVDQAVPGLLELSVRQMQAMGRPDLAGALDRVLERYVRGQAA